MGVKRIPRRGEPIDDPENTPAAIILAAERRTDCMECGLPETK